MKIILMILIRIIGAVISSFIGVGICQFFIDRQDEKDARRYHKEVESNKDIDFIAEMNCESNIKADIKTLKKHYEKRRNT